MSRSNFSDKQRSSVASASHNALHSSGGAAGRVRRHNSPGPYRSLRELSLAGLVGSVIWRPPTYVGSRDRSPTAIAAPHFICNDEYRRNRLHQKHGFANRPSHCAMRCRRLSAPPRRGDRGAAVPGKIRARHDRLRLFADEEAKSIPFRSMRKLARRRRDARAAGDRRPRQAADHARLDFRRPAGIRSMGHPRAGAGGAARLRPIS